MNEYKLKIVQVDGDARKRSAELFERYFTELTGVSVKYADLRRDENGKPMPINGWHFSLSHSGSFWALAVDRSEIGIDIEVPRVVSERVVRRVLADDELPEQGDVLRTWVIKEAYAKLLGVGIGLDFRSVSVPQIKQKARIEDYSADDYICYIVQKVL